MIAVLDYGLGNTGSILNALDRLGVRAIKTNNPGELKKAEALIFPGDGAAPKAMENLSRMGLINPVKEFLKSDKPFLGICLGMQILMDFSEEGDVECLGVIKGSVWKFNNGMRIPQIGWNQIKYQKSKFKNQKHKSKIKNLFNGVSDECYFYFINSYYCEPYDKSIITATTDYGSEFCSVFVKNNIFGVQFHPEKSGKVGLRMLKNWISSF